MQPEIGHANVSEELAILRLAEIDASSKSIPIFTNLAWPNKSLQKA